MSIEPSALVCAKVCIGRKEYSAGRIKGPERDCRKTKTRLAIGSESHYFMRWKMVHLFFASWEIMTQNVTIVSVDVNFGYIFLTVGVAVVVSARFK